MRCVISGGLAEAAAESGELDTTRHSLLNVKPYRGECLLPMGYVCLESKLTQRMELVRPRSCGERDGLSVSTWRSDWIGKGRDSPVPSHICCPRTLLSRWKRCW